MSLERGRRGGRCIKKRPWPAPTSLRKEVPLSKRQSRFGFYFTFAMERLEA